MNCRIIAIRLVVFSIIVGFFFFHSSNKLAWRPNLAQTSTKETASPSEIAKQYWLLSAEGAFAEAGKLANLCGLNPKKSIDREIIRYVTDLTPRAIYQSSSIKGQKPGSVVIGEIEKEIIQKDQATVIAITYFRNKPLSKTKIILNKCKGEWKIDHVTIHYEPVAPPNEEKKKQIA